MVRKSYIITLAIVVTLAAGTLIGWWTYSDHRSAAGTSPAGTSQKTNPVSPPPASGSQPSTETPKTYLVKIYFAKHPQSDNNPSLTFPVNRTSASLGVARFAISEVLKGPSANEQASGYFTTVRLRDDPSNCSGQDFKIAIVNSSATLQFCRQFDHLGVVADGQAKSEIEATLKQFSSVKKVIILNKGGRCEFDLSGVIAVS